MHLCYIIFKSLFSIGFIAGVYRNWMIIIGVLLLSVVAKMSNTTFLSTSSRYVAFSATNVPIVDFDPSDSIQLRSVYTCLAEAGAKGLSMRVGKVQNAMKPKDSTRDAISGDDNHCPLGGEMSSRLDIDHTASLRDKVCVEGISEKGNSDDDITSNTDLSLGSVPNSRLHVSDILRKLKTKGRIFLRMLHHHAHRHKWIPKAILPLNAIILVALLML